MLRLERRGEAVVCAIGTRVSHMALGDGVEIVLVLRLRLASRLHRLMILAVGVRPAVIPMVLRAPQAALYLGCARHGHHVLQVVHRVRRRFLLERVRGADHLRLAERLFPLVARMADLVDAIVVVRSGTTNHCQTLVLSVLLNAPAAILKHLLHLRVERCLMRGYR